MEKKDDLNGLCRCPGKHILDKRSTGRRWLSCMAILLFLVCWLLGTPTRTRASWLIDKSKFHVSAHGQNSCLDCHDDVEDRTLHPNPGDVNRKLEDLFTPDRCLACHEGIFAKIEQGAHAGKKVEVPEEYRSCLRCHDPHEQMRVGEARFDATRPPHEQCSACHEEQVDLPLFSPEDETCMSCHGSTDREDIQGTERMADLCFYCHGTTGTEAQRLTAEKVPLMRQEDFESTVHGDLGCTVCHSGATSFAHSKQTLGDCGRCHLRHHEKVAHDAHIGVPCEACHLRDVRPVRDPESGKMKWTLTAKKGEPSSIHEMVLSKDEGTCRRCHFEGNQVGAATMILPPKSILCMPCHTATFSVGDTTTVIALIVFLVGMVMVFGYVLTGTMKSREEDGAASKFLRLLGQGLRSLFSPGIVTIVRVLILDVMFQRRLYRQTPKRWFIHSLIFWPFLFRFSWGLTALIGSLWQPEWPAVWAMLDKNQPVTAFLFDLTGTMLILGVAFAFIRGFARDTTRPAGLPRQDRLALALIAAIVLLGFILEGLRMAMTGIPQYAAYAFVGRAVAGILFSHAYGFTETYGYVWHLHAVLTGIFFAYLPFSRLIHIIMGPIVLAMNAVAEAGRGRGLGLS